MFCNWADPFAEANAEDSSAGTKEYVHVRVQQRNGRKSLTTVQGLKKEYSYNKILKDLKKEFCCNGTVVQDPELGQVCFYPTGDMGICFFLFIFFFCHVLYHQWKVHVTENLGNFQWALSSTGISFPYKF